MSAPVLDDAEVVLLESALDLLMDQFVEQGYNIPYGHILSLSRKLGLYRSVSSLSGDDIDLSML
jgi:hypothetical protein